MAQAGPPSVGATYDWVAAEPRWEGMFRDALKKVLRQVHATINIDDGAVGIMDRFMYCILAHLSFASGGFPATLEECVKASAKVIPEGIREHAEKEAKTIHDVYMQTRNKKSIRTEFPVLVVQQRLNKEVAHGKLEIPPILYIVALMDFIAADTLLLAANYASKFKSTIGPEDLMVAINADKLMQDLFKSVQKLPVVERRQRISMTYSETIREMLASENQYLTNLDMIVKVFLEVFETQAGLFGEDDIRSVFGNIRDIKELTYSILTMLEDAVEGAKAAQRNVCTQVGSRFLEMTEQQEFDVYVEYAANYRAACDRLGEAAGRPEVQAYLKSVDPQFLTATQFILPELLKAPLYHMLHYCELLDVLHRNTARQHPEEKELLAQARTAMGGLRHAVGPRRNPDVEERESYLESTKHKMQQTQLLADDLRHRIQNWDKLLPQGTTLLRSGRVNFMGDKRKITDRHVFLFDSVVVTCKLNKQPHEYQYRLKESFPTRNLTVSESPDTVDAACAFMVSGPDLSQSFTFIVETQASKRQWMAGFLNQAANRFLQRMYKQKLKEWEDNLDSIVPDAAVYPFAEEDRSSNIRFEAGAGQPTVTAGTLVKLVERLTYPQYADTTFLRQFLTTYRSFCSERQLLQSLIDRYNIPDPPFMGDDALYRRFVKSYATPIRLRVFNVLKHWVDKHFYDFAKGTDLLMQLLRFIKDTPFPAAMAKMRTSLTNSITKQQRNASTPIAIDWTGHEPPPPIEWLVPDLETFHLLYLSPFEVARQLTLIESEMLRKITPPELVGQTWNKRPQEAPNVVAFTARVNTVSYWAQRAVTETANLQERTEVLSFLLEVLRELRSLGNFNGIMELTSALNAASVKRLKFTWAEVHPKRVRVLEECNLLTGDKKAMREALANAHPPCLPYLGTYQSDITFIEDGNPDFLPADGDTPENTLINFKKRRQVAAVIDKIQQYQNQPYRLEVEPRMRDWLQRFPPSHAGSIELPSPTASMKERNAFEKSLFDRSMALEPRSIEEKANLPISPRVVNDPKYLKGIKEVLSMSISTKTVRSRAPSGLSAAQSRPRTGSSASLRSVADDGRARSGSAASTDTALSARTDSTSSTGVPPSPMGRPGASAFAQSSSPSPGAPPLPPRRM